MSTPFVPARPFFVVNPHSANGATRARFLELLPALRDAFPAMEHAFTDGPMHAARLAADAAGRGADLVASCGGDGTLNEVASGLVESGKAAATAVAVMPSGTGCDFRKVIGMGPGFAGAVEYLRTGVLRTVDHGVLDFVDGEGRPARRAFGPIACPRFRPGRPPSRRIRRTCSCNSLQ